MSCRRVLSLALTILVSLPMVVRCPAWAGAWSQAKGSYYTKFSGIFYSSDEVYNDMGKRDPLGRTRTGSTRDRDSSIWNTACWTGSPSLPR